MHDDENGRARAYGIARRIAPDGADMSDVVQLARYIETGRIIFTDDWITERDRRVVRTLDEAFADNVKLFRPESGADGE